MNTYTITDRVKRIQQQLELEPDGIIGSDTLTAIENVLFKNTDTPAAHALTISRSGLDQLIAHEVVSKHYYNRYLKKPVWPGGSSGVTVGIGYDLGYNSATQVQKDWSGRLPDTMLEKLKSVSGLRAGKAQAAVVGLDTVAIPFEQASRVFSESTLPRYAALTLKTYPGVEALLYDAQAALLSLVYNRGSSMSGTRRREMAAIRPLVRQQDYPAIAQQILNMKRLWEGRGLDGLLKRRDAEAALLLGADRQYEPAEIIRA